MIKKVYFYYLGTRCHGVQSGTGKQLFGVQLKWVHLKTYLPSQKQECDDWWESNTKVDSCFILLDSHFSDFFFWIFVSESSVGHISILGPLYKNTWSFKSHYIVSLVNLRKDTKFQGVAHWRRTTVCIQRYWIRNCTTTLKFQGSLPGLLAFLCVRRY